MLAFFIKSIKALRAILDLSIDKLLFLASSPSGDAYPLISIELIIILLLACAVVSQITKSITSLSVNSGFLTTDFPFSKLINAEALLSVVRTNLSSASNILNSL